MDPAQEPTDKTLMQAFAAGDAGAFETLYDRHQLAVWRYVRRSVHDAALADELVQDAWFTLVRQAPRYEPRARFRTWLFTLAHHRLVDHFRTHHPHASLDATTDDGASLADTLAADSGFGPLRQLQSREQAQALLDALAALPAAQRKAFLLQAEGALTVTEIAQTTGVPLETAKSRLRYARASLRQTLEGFL
jgi:RNA polymerase sigma-70 factor (ECF subfamily)